jgi:hypothetical protein
MCGGGNPNNNLFWHKGGWVQMLIIGKDISLSSLQIYRLESAWESERKSAFY